MKTMDTIMKRLLSLTMIAGLLFALSSCNNDDDDKEETQPDDPATTFESTTYSGGCGKEIKQVTITDHGKGTGTRTLKKDVTYILDGFVFVNEGQTLTIEPGTVIKGKSGQGENASALIVARGATIKAEGTASEPIIFTSAADQLARATDGSMCDATNRGATARGEWGGVIILGSAPNNTASQEVQVEGIPTTEERAQFGDPDGNFDPNDNSGVFKYVSIRHGGSNIGANNEINGLTLASVGANTEIHHVEVFANQDDGIEWFGGTANTHHMVMTNCGDDALDYDMGYTGDNQFYFVYQSDDGIAGRGGEHDGGTDPEDGTPYATPIFYNVTSIGGNQDDAIIFRDNAGGEYHNSIFHNYDEGIRVEDLASGQDAYQQYLDSNIVLMNNLIANVGGTAIASMDNSSNDLSGSVGIQGNAVKNGSVSRTDVIPATGDMTASFSPAPSSFYQTANYNGCFDPGAGTPEAWMDWTRTFDEYGTAIQ